MQPCLENSRSFFAKLQSAEGLDLRDGRGKKHDLAVVLMGVTLAVLSNRDGSLSSIHRHLVNHYEQLVRVLGVKEERPVSRSQLPLILEKVGSEVFDALIFEHFGVTLNETEPCWVAIDGKELRGSIAAGAKRGEVMVQAVKHESRQTIAQTYYAGEKESEVPSVRQLLEKDGLKKQKISLDALHCKPQTLLLIARANGNYLVGLKANQKELRQQVLKTVGEQAVLWKQSGVEKGHGRIDERSFEFYDILEMEKAERWRGCQMRTAIKVMRHREELKSGKKSLETSYYVTNETGDYEELVCAVRDHWQVETNNHLRDVTLKEDELRSKKSKLIE